MQSYARNGGYALQSKVLQMTPLSGKNDGARGAMASLALPKKQLQEQEQRRARPSQRTSAPVRRAKAISGVQSTKVLNRVKRDKPVSVRRQAAFKPNRGADPVSQELPWSTLNHPHHQFVMMQADCHSSN